MCKNVIEEQKRMGYEKCWYSELKEDATWYEIDLELVKEIKKSEWKKMVKEQIRKQIKLESRRMEQIKRKLRHQKEQKFEKQGYVKELGKARATEIVRTRLEMWDIGRNMGKDWKCKCGEQETTEHIIDCKMVNVNSKEKVHAEWMNGADVGKLEKVTDFKK